MLLKKIDGDYMNSESSKILEGLKEQGLISSATDLTGGDKTGMIFDYMIRKNAYYLDNEPETVYTENSLKKGRFLHKIITLFGRLFLRTPQIIEKRSSLLEGDIETFPDERENFNEDAKLPDGPAVYISNHGFKDDILASLLAIKKRTYLLFGSVPMFYGSLDGLLLSKNGAVIVNRKVQSSKSSSVDKCKYLLQKGQNILIFPEGVWNKKADGSFLDFYRGFYKIAKKEDGTFYPIVPIVHYISNTYEKGKSNPIHTIVDDPIYLDNSITEEEAITYIRDRMFTWYWKLMEKYGVTTRETALNGFNTSVEAWEHELTERVKTADKYDINIETSADLKKNPSIKDVWEPIANANINSDNIYMVKKARSIISEYDKNDFQHKF